MDITNRPDRPVDSPQLRLPSATLRLNLARWQTGARNAEPQPGAPTPPIPGSPAKSAASTTPAKPDAFPFIRLPGGEHVEANPAQALRRQRQAGRTDESNPEDAPFRPPSSLPADAPPKEIASNLQAALDRQDALGLPKPPDFEQKLAAMQAAREQAAQQAAEEARRAAEFANQEQLLANRVRNLGSLLQLIAGRYGGAATASDARRQVDAVA